MILTSSYLVKIRKRAICGKIWFKVLDGLERGILGLSAKLLKVVYSTSLILELNKIVTKIENALKSVFKKRLEDFGVTRAKILVGYAIQLGYLSALRWIDNEEFAHYLTFMSLNTSLSGIIYA